MSTHNAPLRVLPADCGSYSPWGQPAQKIADTGHHQWHWTSTKNQTKDLQFVRLSLTCGSPVGNKRDPRR